MDEELFREEYHRDLLISEKMCEEIDYKLRQLGNLENPHVNTVKSVVKELIMYLLSLIIILLFNFKLVKFCGSNFAFAFKILVF